MHLYRNFADLRLFIILRLFYSPSWLFLSRTLLFTYSSKPAYKSNVSDIVNWHEALKSQYASQIFVPHPSLGYWERKLCPRKIMKSIILRLVCWCTQVSLSSALSTQTSFCLRFRRKAIKSTLRSRIDDPPPAPPKLAKLWKLQNEKVLLFVKCKQCLNFRILFSNLFFPISNILKTWKNV